LSSTPLDRSNLPPFKKILIANRGEIALRIIRACRELGIKTVAVYSSADITSLHVKLADEAICIGPPSPKLSYLNMMSILSAAEVTGVEAIHPGYGFLSENAEFARLVRECKLTFIGPTPENIEAMGEKTRARSKAKEAGVPMLPGTVSAVADAEEAIEAAKKIGYPVILKAAAGGGGRGIFIIRTEKDLSDSFQRCSEESRAAFGDGSLYVEKFCENPRHVEIQVACDRHGNHVFLGERDCSVQRRHQKLIEEAPCPILTPEIRKAMGEAAIALCKHVNYESVGTVEFLVDTDLKFYFMEMNTRIQVEHPVTEMITGIDLIKEQIQIAAGKKLSFSQSDIKLNGHAFEVRINAEDPDTFSPSPGLITALHVPGGFGVRIDSFIYDEYKVVPFYDSLLAKLIVHGRDRQEAIAKMRQALDEFVVSGVKTTLPLHREIFQSQRFVDNDYSTRFIEEFLATRPQKSEQK
jgi:acetyl-CoA carboxylase biotin carboxylase subunit